MKKLDLFLIALVPVQLWGMVIYFLFSGYPDSWPEFFDITVTLAYSTFFNVFEALLFALGLWAISFLIPKSADRAKKSAIQLFIWGVISLTAILAQALLYSTELYRDWPFLIYLSINLTNTRLYRRIALFLFAITLGVALGSVVVSILKSNRGFAWTQGFISSLSSLAWLYIGIDAFLLIAAILRGFHVI